MNKQPHTVAIIQARMSSSRLPGKVLREIAGKPMLAHVVQRTQRAASVHQVIVATTRDESDDLVADFCLDYQIPFYRGSMHDVLDRYYQAAKQYQAQIIVRITADCPLIDPQVIDETVFGFLKVSFSTDPTHTHNFPAMTDLPYDFAANRLPPPWGRTYPIGLDTEVCNMPALEIAWREAAEKHQREHVMPFFYEQPERFRIFHLDYCADYGSLRWTVDTPEDLEMIRKIFALTAPQEPGSWLEILELYQRHPELEQINQQIKPKDYRQVDERQVK
jgi:spore coat polysaccharide biosynthesis protein SpsF